MDIDWFPAAVIIGIVFYVSYLIMSNIGLLDIGMFNSAFGAAFVIGALIVIVMLAKPLFFPQRDIPQQ